MAEQFYTILTAVGKAKIANAAALGEKVELTELALGDGGGSYYNPTEDQTELRNEVWRGDIGTVDVDGENPNWITIQTVVPSQHGGFMIREAGVFDNEGDLIAVGKCPETYKPAAADGSIKDLVIRMILEVSNAASVVLKIDPTVVLATQQQVDGAEARAKAYTDQEVAEVSQALDAHKAAAAPHSGHETPAGAQAKADGAEAAAKTYADQEVADLAGEGRTTETVKGNAAELDAHLSDYATLKAIIGYTDNDIYGIEVDIPSNAITRLAGAVGKVAGADFDNINAFKRRRCIVADDRTVLAYHGDAGYTETGKTTVQIVKNETTYPVGTHVQVMVEQPKFYYKRVPLQIEPIANGVGSHLRKWRDYICDYPIYDFKVHPCFIRDGREYNYIYYPAYEGCIYDVSASKYLTADEQVADFDVDKLSSIAGVKPASGLTQSLTLPNTRKLANNRGEGWQQMDVLAHYAEAMLMSIEYATFDFQTAIGRGVVNKEGGTGNESVNTGATANLGNSSGMATGTNGLVSVSYRGRENPWGSIWIWNDGLNIEAKSIHEAYWADSGFASDIKTSPYKNCGFTLAKSNGYISAIGYSQECDFMYIPSETLGAENRPLNDYFYQNYTHDGFLVALLGGDWTNESSAGAFSLYVSYLSGARSRHIGGGLLCLPKK